MVSYSTASSATYQSSGGMYQGSESTGMYTTKRNQHCCGSFSRGQRCVGCTSG
ncbi:hypothetical protein HYU22_05435 [Candidatus Woesearchaeota archaeon]|nr:hypothetical protein [Candidatus Woesearchaeota archaeon]